MSSGFVSGGTIDQPLERDDEWLKAQQGIEDLRRRKEDEAKQDGGKSLYEILQQNKAAKQDAFEESIRLKNQFRNLDEDEVEFLDAVLESTRAKDEAVKRETRAQLELFRRQQEEADRNFAVEASYQEQEPPEAPNTRGQESTWTVHTRKRKRVRERESAIPSKQNKVSSSGGSAAAREAIDSDQKTTVMGMQVPVQARKGHDLPCKAQVPSEISKSGGRLSAPTGDHTSQMKQQTAKVENVEHISLSLGLGSYDSDEDQ